jgi:uncharacterized repeat protein (TIGR01451 family)
MSYGLSRQWARLASWVGAGLVLVACATDVSSGKPEATGRISSAMFTNGGFETGAAGAAPVGWTVNDNLNDGITVQTPQTYAGLDLAAGGKPLTTTLAATNQPDPDLGAGATLRVCRYGAQCARVNFHSSTTYGNGKNVNTLQQAMTIGAGDVDPSDNTIHVRFAVAPVLQNPAHPANEQPYYFVIVTDVTKNTILYSDFNLSGTAGLAWQKINAGLPTEIDYTDWQLVDVSGAGGAIAQGDIVQLQVIGSGCSLGGHFGEVYVDGAANGGPVLPGLTVEGTGPAQANAGSNVTYNIGYTNGSGAAETGVVIDFTTPPGTTFQSFTAPPGAMCTTPAVGATGTIVCTFTGAVPAGAAGSFSVTVNIDAATTGTITAGQYQISSSSETPLLGPPILTLVGCTLDAQCPAGDWCDEATKDCTPKLVNGKPIPNDPSHTNPTLNGTCTVAAGSLVCASGVCDPSNNECGYANGDGPCTTGAVCQSGACSTNGKCEPAGGCNVDADCTGGDWCDESTNTCTPKIANGGAFPNDPKHTNPTLGGTCNQAGAALVCVSGVCDPNGNVCGVKLGDGTCTATAECITGACITTGGNTGKCEPCASNANCVAPTPACNTTTNACVQCTATDTAACTGTTPLCSAGDVCVACNGDNGTGTTEACPVGDPYCAATGACTKCTTDTMCTTGMHPGPFCDTGTGACTTTCQTDAECGTGNWCNSFSGTGMCEPKLPNGQGVTGQPCTPTLGTRACVSGVCDTGNMLCGYANGDGPCSTGAVCQSGACSTNGTCEPAGGCNVDADCTTGNWCDEASHTCTPQLPNGSTIPNDPAHMNPTLNGMCSAQAGTLVCQSGVCDPTDNECGFANGDGPCTAGDAGDGRSVCRSGICASTGPNSGLCEGCNVNGDCPTGEVCSATNTCVMPTVDAGTDAGPGADAGVDSGSGFDSGTSVDASTGDSGSSEDASAGDSSTSSDGSSEDATTEDASPDASTSGILEGGGCSSTGAPVRGGNVPGSLLGGLSILVVLAARRRRQAQ